MWLQDYLNKNKIVSQYASSKAGFAHLSLIQEALLIVGTHIQTKKAQTIVKENEYKASLLVDQLKRLDPSLRVVYYNHEESLRVEAIVQSEQMRASRIEALYQVMSQDYDVLITHTIASSRKISKKEVLEERIIRLKVGDEMDPKDLSNKLIKMGYSRVKYVEKPFTFAMRGGICDVFSIQMESPLRIEFFDVEVESLRSIDIETQRSESSLDDAVIVFAHDILLEDTDLEYLEAKIKNALEEEESQELIHEVEMKKDIMMAGLYDETLYPFLSYWKNYNTILDYVYKDSILISPIEAVERFSLDNDIEVHDYMQEQAIMHEMIYMEGLYHKHNYQSFMNVKEYQADDEVHLPWHESNIVSTSLSDTLKWLKKEAIDRKVIIALNDLNMEDFMNILLNNNVPYRILSDLPKEPGIYLDYSDIDRGFVLEDLKYSVYTEFELYQHKQAVFKYDNKFQKAEQLSQLQDLNVNDYVVHRQYGIGRYRGIITREVEGIHKDFMHVEYRDEDELYIPLEQFSLVRKFLSSEAASVRLSKLGSSAWEKSKARIKADVADVADRLVNLYSSRMETKGYAFSPDTEYQKEFEKEFPYLLTKDQEQAIQEIKADMESDLPMDRLLCGDVGFGKTEVAIRAAFKAFVDEKQVIFLCPTTILSAQHTRTLKERFKNYAVRTEVLNRFVSEKEQKKIIKDFREGKVDILIGTHRVLSKDVKPKDLGLLIIDEEQRFGVEHKERIKEFKLAVDVLSLSATPIPRTLQMSLVGLRALSQLNTPPSNRMPVMTYVIEKNTKTLYDIISKELNRGGQAFYLYNNVEQLYSVATSIGMHVKEAKVGVVHGQMDRTEIEDVMLQFINKELNVLVCTTIIETGIDIPNANTIIVDNAHRFGLSQLYQIKGRVGRSDRLAYAYFVVPEKMNLTEIAQKRLQAIKEFTQLGSGYKIAMRDLTIRGAGELLGGNQSGFIDTVGMDLYVELLKEAIAQRKGLPIETPEVKEALNLKIEGYLPKDFTSDEGETLELYQTINAIKNLSQLNAFNDMIKDRYGTLPSAVLMLLEKTRLELFLQDDRVQSFKERAKGVELVFTPEYSGTIDGIQLFELVSSRSSDIAIKYINQTIIITLPLYPEWAEDLIYILEELKERDYETG